MARVGRRASSTRPCCLVSEILEQAGLDRAKIRQIERQVLEGIVLLCRWQLERMETQDAARAGGSAPRRRARSVTVE